LSSFHVEQFSMRAVHHAFKKQNSQKTKLGGTADIPEHRASAFVVGAGNENTVRRYSMTNRFMMSVAAAALIAGTGFANAQGTGGREAPSAGSAAQQSAPSSERGAPSTGQMNRDSASESKGSDKGMKATQSEDRSPGAAKNQRAEDKDMPGQKSKGMSSEHDATKGGKDMKAEGREGSKDMKAEGREGSKDMKAEQKGGPSGQTTGQGATQRDQGRDQSTTQRDQSTTQGRDQSTPQSRDQKAQGQQDRMNVQGQGGAAGTGQSTSTTGQAGAAAKLSTEQRTQITSVIKEQRVEPTNVNISVSVGTRIPRDVTFHTLPERVVTIYPEWRGFKFIRVKEQIVIVDPNTYEIVAVLES
jgi:hypothetical protein